LPIASPSSVSAISARAFTSDDLEMIGFATDHHADRDEGVIFVRRQRDRAGHFQRAGHGDGLVGVAGRLDRGTRALQEQVIQMLVETGLDDQDAGHQSARSSTMLRP